MMCSGIRSVEFSFDRGGRPATAAAERPGQGWIVSRSQLRNGPWADNCFRAVIRHAAVSTDPVFHWSSTVTR